MQAMGRWRATLEREFAARFGFAGSVATGFGRGALVLAVRAALAGGAGEVLVPEFACAQVPEAVRRAGGRPAFYPVGTDLTVEAEAFCRAFTRQTRAAVVVHYFSEVLGNIAELARFCRERSVPLIEDCALALGAAKNGRPAGTFGDVAVFSFTKSEWCYGGGLAAASSPEWLGKLRESRRGSLRRCEALCRAYGALRRWDFLANRPEHCAAAARAGRRLERALRIRGGNFFDAGRFDAAMPEIAARRALRLLRTLPEITARQRALVGRLEQQLFSMRGLLHRSAHREGSAAFLLLRSAKGRAVGWRDRAARNGVTLRLAWPAYQAEPAAPCSPAVDWLARHLLILEIHPALTPEETGAIAVCLLRLAAE